MKIMISEKYIKKLTSIIRKFFPNANDKIFIFGSSLREEYLEHSTFPYVVDLVNFNKTSKDFAQFVLSSETKLWI